MLLTFASLVLAILFLTSRGLKGGSDSGPRSSFLNGRPRASLTSPLPKPPLPDLKYREGVGTGIMDFEDERRRAKSLDIFDLEARGFLQEKYSEVLPAEVLQFTERFRKFGPDAFPDHNRRKDSILIRVRDGLHIRVIADIGMYWTDPLYGHVYMDVEKSEAI